MLHRDPKASQKKLIKILRLIKNNGSAPIDCSPALHANNAALMQFKDPSCLRMIPPFVGTSRVR